MPESTDQNNFNPNKTSWESTQMKNIYIELNDYSYYHQPSNVKDRDERHIGRKKFHDKLKNIIIDSAQQTGAYLITGYRGMGKTSLVNNVLSEIKSSGIFEIRKWLVRNFRVLFLLIPFAAINFNQTLTCILLFVILVASFYTFRSQFDLNKGNRKNLLKNLLQPKETNKLSDIYKSFSAELSLAILTIIIFLISLSFRDLEPKFSDRFREIAKIFTIVLGYSSVYTAILNAKLNKQNYSKFWSFLPKLKIIFFDKNGKSTKPSIWAVFVINLSFLILIFFLHLSKGLTSDNIFKLGILTLIIFFFSIAVNYFSSGISIGRYQFLFNYFNILSISFITYTHTIYFPVFFKFYLFVLAIVFLILYRPNNVSQTLKSFFQGTAIKVIPISLAQDDISDNSVLKYIANQAFTKYKEYLRAFDNSYRFFYKTLIILVIYSFSLFLFYYSPAFTIANNLRIETGISDYLPSQIAYYYGAKPDSEPYKNILDIFDEISESQIETSEDSLNNLYKQILLLNLNEKDSLINLDKQGQRTDSIDTKGQVINNLQDSISISIADSIYCLDDKVTSFSQIGFDLFRYCEFINSIQNIKLDPSSSNVHKYNLTLDSDKYIRFILSNFKEEEEVLLKHILYGSESKKNYKLDSTGLSKLKEIFPYADLTNNGSLLTEIFETSRKNFYSNYLKVSLVYIDYLIFEFYGEFVHIFLDGGNSKGVNNWFLEGFHLSPRFHILPLNFDYFLAIYFCIIIILYQIIIRTGLFFTSHHRILSRFRKLIDNINAEVVENQNFGIGNAFGLFRRKNYPKYETRDIENELISIFNDMDRVL